jgi:DNA polymerase-4
MILHIDMDAFFAAVEQRDNPALKGRPVIISGKSERSVVSTASYEARKFGIHSAMPVFQARHKCRHLIIVPGDMAKYRANSMRIMKILAKFSPVVEQVSIDEAYLDISGSQRLLGSPEQIARAIKKEIDTHLSLTCSIGVAPLKFLAKIASDLQKPDGFTLIRPQEVAAFIDRLPIHKVPGVGKRAMKQMVSLQIQTLGDVKKFSRPLLNKKFGKMGDHLLALSEGNDTGTVQAGHQRKSISSETTLPEDVSGFETVKKIILGLSQSVGRQLRKKNLYCRTVSIKLKFSDFTQITRSLTFDTPVCSSNAIFDQAVILYQKVVLKKKIRLVGVGVSSLMDQSTPYQMPLLETVPSGGRQWERVDRALDGIDAKYGSQMVQKASLNRLKERRIVNEPHKRR